jgi:hypothetical protein
MHDCSVPAPCAHTDVVGLATRGGSTQWQMLHGLLENTIYGGRVDNKFDAQVGERNNTSPVGKQSDKPSFLSTRPAVATGLLVAKFMANHIWHTSYTSPLPTPHCLEASPSCNCLFTISPSLAFTSCTIVLRFCARTWSSTSALRSWGQGEARCGRCLDAGRSSPPRPTARTTCR